MSSLLLDAKRSHGSAFFSYAAVRFGWLGLILQTLSWVVPNHYRPWSSFQSEALSFTGFGLFVAGLLCAQQASGRWSTLPAAGWLAFLLAFLPWIQLALSIGEYVGDAVVVTLYLLGFAGAIWAGHNCASDPMATIPLSLSGIMTTIGVAGLASAVVGLIQWSSLAENFALTIFQVEAGGRAVGNLAQANQLGTLLLMATVAVVHGHERACLGRAATVSCVGLLSLVLVLTQSRTGILSALALAAFALTRRSSIGSRVPAWSICAWIAMLLLSSSLLPLFSEALLLERTRGSLTYTHTSDRLLIWHQIAHAIMQSPWWGYGWNLTASAAFVGALGVPGDLTYTYAHCLVLDLLAWNGLLLGGLLVALCAAWLLTRFMRVGSVDAVYLFALLLPVVVHSLLEYPFAYAYFLLPVGFAVGHIDASLQARSVEIVPRILWGLLAAWTLVGCYLCYEYVLIEEDFRIVRFEGMRVGQTPVDYQPPKIWLTSHMGSMLTAARQQAKPGMTPDQMSNLRKAADRFAYGAISYRYALALGLNGRPEESRQRMLLIRNMYGERYYQGVKEDMLDLAAQKYPQLHKVRPP